MSVVLIAAISLTTIVYSAFNTELQIKGEAMLRVKEDVRVTNLKSTTSSSTEKYNSRYGKDSVNIYAELPANVTVTYEVEITNKTPTDYIISNISQTSSNPNVTVTISAKVNDIISKTNTKKFTITITNTKAATQTINITNQYTFLPEVEPTITMSDLPTSHTKGNVYPLNLTYTVGNSGLKEASCKSNIDGAVTNLNTLSKGAHTITCTVTANSGKTKSISKTTTITSEPYSITNLIKNGSYENGSTSWTLSGATIVSTEASHGSKSLCLGDTPFTTGTKMSRQTLSKSSPTLNHKYYGRLMFLSNSTFSTLDPRFEWYNADATNAMMPFAYKNIKVTEWTLMSNILQITESTYLSKSWYVRNFNVNPNSVSYTDELVLIDLTESFGSGKEPTKEWCDENIKYFDGTTTIYK